MIRCHNNECVGMTALIRQSHAHGLVEVQDLVQQRPRIVRMPGVVDASSLHEHEETFIVSRQDIERAARHLGQGRNAREFHLSTVDDIGQVVGREHAQEFRRVACGLKQ